MCPTDDLAQRFTSEWSTRLAGRMLGDALSLLETALGEGTPVLGVALAASGDTLAVTVQNAGVFVQNVCLVHVCACVPLSVVQSSTCS